MAYELRDGTGTIFKNKFKEEGDNKPDYKGEVMWRGEKIEIAHWVKQGQNGKFFSVKLQEPRAQVGQPSPASMTPHVPAPVNRRDPSRSAPPLNDDDMGGDSIPF
jgi:hypothetical protein